MENSAYSVKLLLLAPNLLTVSRWRFPGSLAVAKGDFVLFPYHTNEMTGSLVVFQGRSR